MDYIIRELSEAEFGLLEDFLYEAIFVPDGVPAPSRSIIRRPELQLYTAGFGTEPDDLALAAQVGTKVAGAVWVRRMNDYGHIDDSTPSLAISLYPEYRGAGIGTALMREMLRRLRQRDYRQVSLSVQKANYAVRMYRKTGFQIYAEHKDEYIMVCRL